MEGGVIYFALDKDQDQWIKFSKVLALGVLSLTGEDPTLPRFIGQVKEFLDKN